MYPEVILGKTGRGSRNLKGGTLLPKEIEWLSGEKVKINEEVEIFWLVKINLLFFFFPFSSLTS